MNAVIYARYSSHNQTEQSIDGQLRVCYEFAKRENIKIVGEYIDRAIAGKTDARPDFQKMITDSKKKQFDYVIVYKLDRFARNRYDSAVYKHKLKQNNVRVLSAMENISDSPEGIILEAVLEASAEYYSLELSQKVKRGLRESALKGTFTGGHAPIGYKVVNKKLVIDEETAPIIKYIFEQYAQGVSKKQLIDELNAKGIRNTIGKPLGYTSFQVALKNKKYIGVGVYDGVEYKNYCPPLISKELFNQVQERLSFNAHAPGAGKAKTPYLLNRKAFCGMCGDKLVGECGRGRHGTKYYYYACATKKKVHTCKKKNEKKDFLEWYVVEQTLEYVLTPARMDYIAENIVTEYDKEFNDSKIKGYEKLIRKIDRDIDKCFQLMVQSNSSAIIKRSEETIKKYELQKQDLEIDLAKLKIANDIRYTKEDILIWLKQFCKGDPMEESFRQRIIDVFINSVYVYDDKIVIYYNIKDGKQVSYIDNCENLENADPSETPLERTKSTALSDASSVRFSNVLAEREGFEPSKVLPLHEFQLENVVRINPFIISFIDILIAFCDKRTTKVHN